MNAGYRFGRLAFAAAVLALVVLPTHGLPAGSPSPPATSTRREDVNTAALLAGARGQAILAGFLMKRVWTVSLDVARSSAVVRAKMVELTDTQLVCKLTRVIYGRIPGEVLQVDHWGLPSLRIEVAQYRLRRELGREPTDAELKAHEVRGSDFTAGGDLILFLDQCRQTDVNSSSGSSSGATVCRCLFRWDARNPRRPLDAREEEVMKVIETGAHLNPSSPSVYLEWSEAAVRAKLTKIGEKSSQWQLKGVLCATVRATIHPPHRGSFLRPANQEEFEAYAKQMPTTLSVGLDPWRLRAEAICGYRAVQQPGRPATEKEIQKEFARLVRTELPPGREAILFIRPQEDAPGKAAWKLVGILRDDPGRPRQIDQLEKRVRQMVGKHFPL